MFTLKPHRPSSAYFQTLHLFQQDNLDTCLDHLNRLLSLHPHHQPSISLLNRVFIRLTTSLDRFTSTEASRLLNLIGIIYKRLGFVTKSQTCFHHAFLLNPSQPEIISNLVFSYLNTCTWDQLPALTHKLDQANRWAITHHQPVPEPAYANLLRLPQPDTNLAVANSQAVRITTNPHLFPSPNPNLLLAYLSSGFRRHATGFLIQHLLRFHQPPFSSHLFSFSPHSDSFTRYLTTLAQGLTPLSTHNTRAIQTRISNLHPQILIDLDGPLNPQYFHLLAKRLAPIQLHYLGFPGTTGARFIDYLITDPFTTPSSLAPYFTEKLIALPHTYQINGPKPHVRKATPSRQFIFASFNYALKLDPQLWSIFLKLLHQVPNSIFWQIGSNPLAQSNLLTLATQSGITPQRLHFLPSVSQSRHLKRFSQASLALDTVRVNGHTTTSDALWAGVPVVTLVGSHFASRVSSSLLSALGLSELITHSLDDYYHLALYLATHPEKLKIIKRKLNTNRPSYPLFDTDRFTRNLETAYLTVWDNYLAGKSPQPFNITDPLPLIHKS